jgi:hypothetical protein
MHKPIDEETRRREAFELQQRMGEIQHTLLVLSGKGGVGISTVAVDLRYVYVGNVPVEINTVCYGCGEMPVRRSRHQLLENHVQAKGLCSNSDTPVSGVGMG